MFKNLEILSTFFCGASGCFRRANRLQLVSLGRVLRHFHRLFLNPDRLYLRKLNTKKINRFFKNNNNF